jgi:hypothetical protein
MTWKCPVCGHDNDESNQFCRIDLLERPAQSTIQHLPQPTVLEESPQRVDPIEPLQTDADSQIPVASASSTQAATVVLQVPPVTGQTQKKAYMVFVNSPVSSLVGQRVPLEFDLFPVTSIGKSLENVLVIPDQEVSRNHAEFTSDGTDIHLKDLNSTNGTRIFDGKAFQPVTGDVVVKPNTILKFGGSTIVKIVTE